MSRTIKLSRKASIRLEEILSYMKTNWSQKVKYEFVDKLDKGLKLLSEFPESHPKSELQQDLHIYVLTKQTTVFYKFSETELIIVTLFDNRQDPKRILDDVQ